MAESSVLEQPQVQEPALPELEEEPLDMSILPPMPEEEPVEEITIPPHNRELEYTLSNMAKTGDYDTLQSMSIAQEQHKLSSAVIGALYASAISKQDARSIVEEMATRSRPRKSNGEAITDNIIPGAHPDIRKAMSDSIDVDHANRITINHQNKNLDLGEGRAARSEHSPVALEAAQYLSVKNREAARRLDEFDKGNFSLENIIEFVNPLGGEDPEGMDIDIWQTGKDLLSGEFNYEDFNTKMESNYGEDWEWRMSGFLAKEGMIDVGILLLAMSPFSPIAFALKAGSSALKARAVAGIARSAVVGVAGGAAQAVQNVTVDREANLGTEIALRTGGALAGEAVFGVARAGIHALRAPKARAAAKEAAELAETKVLERAQYEDAVKTLPDTLTPLAATQRASLVESVQGFNKLAHDTSAKFLDLKEAEDSVLVGLANVLGMDVNKLANMEFDVAFTWANKLSRDIVEESASQFKNQTELSRFLSYDLMALTPGKYETFTDKVSLFLTDKGVAMREFEEGIIKSNDNLLNSMMQFGGVAESANFAGQAAANLTDSRNFSSKIASGLGMLYRDATKGLSVKEKKLLSNILSEGSADTTVYDFDSFVPKLDVPEGSYTPAIREAYTKVRFTLDAAHAVLDEGRVAALKGRVIPYRKGYVEKMSKPSKKKGYVWVREFDNETMAPTEKAAFEIPESTFKAKVDQLTTLVPYRNGHIPRVYDTKKHYVGVAGKEGVSVEASFSSRYEAEVWMKERQALINNDSDKVFKITDNIDTGAGGFTASRSTMDLLSTLGEGAQKSVAAALEESGINSATVKLMLRRLDTVNPAKDFGNKRTQLGIASNKKLQDLRLKYHSTKSSEARKAIEKDIDKELIEATKPTEESLIEYFNIISQNAGQNTWQKAAITQWESKYAQHIVPGSTWAKPDFVEGGTLSSGEKKAAIAFSEYIQRNMFKKSAVERRWDNALISMQDTLVEKAVNGNIGARALLGIVDRVPFAKRLEGMMRFSAAFPKLLSFNVPHFFIQLSQAIPTMGAAFFNNPKTALRAMYKIPGVMSMHGHVMSGKRISREMMKSDTYATYQALAKGGLIADLNTTDIMFSMGTRVDHSVGNIVSRTFKGGIDKTLKFAAAPFKMGEGANRISAFVVVREQLMHAIKQGTKKDIPKFDGKHLTVADIDSPKFLSAVNNKATVLALEMSKAGELRSFSGAGSVLFQFKQVLPKQISMFNSTGLSAREKVGAALALVGFWGGVGVPLAADVLAGLDWVMYDEDDPSSLNTVSDKMDAWLTAVSENASEWTDGSIDPTTLATFAKRGGIAALTDDEVNVVSRVALGSFITDMVDIQHWSDFIVSVAVIGDAFEAMDRIAGVDATILNPITWGEIIVNMDAGASFSEALAAQYPYGPQSAVGKAILGDTTLGAASAEVLRESGKVFSQFGSISRVLDANRRDLLNPTVASRNPFGPEYYSTSSSRGTPVERNNIRDIMLILGFTPGKLVEVFTSQDAERKLKKAFSTYTKNTLDRIRLIQNSEEKRPYIKIINEYARVTNEFSSYTKAKGFDIPTVNNPKKAVINMIDKVFLNTASGGQAK